MPTITLNVRPKQGDEVFLGADPNNPSPGDQILLVERELVNPQTNVKVGSFNSRLTFMKTTGVLLFSGNADHELQGGVICTQGSFRSTDTQSVFAIVGGTGTYARARGTLTLQIVGTTERFTYDWLP
jgi:hypothetical protein